jgi:hypothetical protein
LWGIQLLLQGAISTESYSYDAAGDLTNSGYSYNSSNELTASPGSAADLASNSTTWKGLHDAAKQAGACVEPLFQSGPGHVHEQRE